MQSSFKRLPPPFVSIRIYAPLLYTHNSVKKKPNRIVRVGRDGSSVKYITDTAHDRTLISAGDFQVAMATETGESKNGVE